MFDVYAVFALNLFLSLFLSLCWCQQNCMISCALKLLRSIQAPNNNCCIDTINTINLKLHGAHSWDATCSSLNFQHLWPAYQKAMVFQSRQFSATSTTLGPWHGCCVGARVEGRNSPRNGVRDVVSSPSEIGSLFVFLPLFLPFGHFPGDVLIRGDLSNAQIGMENH